MISPHQQQLAWHHHIITASVCRAQGVALFVVNRASLFYFPHLGVILNVESDFGLKTRLKALVLKTHCIRILIPI